MSTVALIQYEQASPGVRAVFDDIKATRNVPDVNNFWKALANQPDTLRRTWQALREVMAPGALDPLAKEMIYIAVSVANNCDYCIHSHTALTAAHYVHNSGRRTSASGMNAFMRLMVSVMLDPVSLWRRTGSTHKQHQALRMLIHCLARCQQEL